MGYYPQSQVRLNAALFIAADFHEQANPRLSRLEPSLRLIQPSTLLMLSDGDSLSRIKGASLLLSWNNGTADFCISRSFPPPYSAAAGACSRLGDLTYPVAQNAWSPDASQPNPGQDEDISNEASDEEEGDEEDGDEDPSAEFGPAGEPASGSYAAGFATGHDGASHISQPMLEPAIDEQSPDEDDRQALELLRQPPASAVQDGGLFFTHISPAHLTKMTIKPSNF